MTDQLDPKFTPAARRDLARLRAGETFVLCAGPFDQLHAAGLVTGTQHAPVLVDADDHGPGCDGPYNCVCSTTPAGMPELVMHFRLSSPEHVTVPAGGIGGASRFEFVGGCDCGYRTKPKRNAAIANRSAGLHVSAANKREGAKFVDAYVAYRSAARSAVSA